MRVILPPFFICCATSIPLSKGISTSSKRTSGSSSSTRCKASTPVFASPTTSISLALVNRFRIPLRMISLSSASTTRVAVCAIRPPSGVLPPGFPGFLEQTSYPGHSRLNPRLYAPAVGNPDQQEQCYCAQKCGQDRSQVYPCKQIGHL